MNNREMPQLPNAPEKSGAEEQKVEKKSGPIEVVALRKGFFKNHRKKPGDNFKVDSFDQLGTWMQCTDKVMQKKHEQAMAEKKAKIKAAGK
jgi:hypothetical protein